MAVAGTSGDQSRVSGNAIITVYCDFSRRRPSVRSWMDESRLIGYKLVLPPEKR